MNSRKRITRFSLLIVLLAGTVCGQQPPLTPADLPGRTLALRTPARGDKLQFDRDGILIKSKGRAPAGIFGNVQINEADLKKDKLVLSCRRVFPVWDELNKQFRAAPGEALTIEIEAPANRAPEAWQPVLETVFLREQEAAQRLDEWRVFLERRHLVGRDPCASKDSPIPAQRIVPPKPKTHPDPAYPEQGRGRDALVILWVWAGINGQVRDLLLKREAGLGFDEAAAEAVMRWTFEPATLNSLPVEAPVEGEIAFCIGDCSPETRSPSKKPADCPSGTSNP